MLLMTTVKRDICELVCFWQRGKKKMAQGQELGLVILSEANFLNLLETGEITVV